AGAIPRMDAAAGARSPVQVAVPPPRARTAPALPSATMAPPPAPTPRMPPPDSRAALLLPRRLHQQRRVDRPVVDHRPACEARVSPARPPVDRVDADAGANVADGRWDRDDVKPSLRHPLARPHPHVPAHGPPAVRGAQLAAGDRVPAVAPP